ncbi:uncharacterized protein [Coffea arabica]|uniref:Retrotransposon gag domain-containing protein n=1 Tax=Coffea arabica TaxID=13443 RepID=A0ABM4WN45_COFAR
MVFGEEPHKHVKMFEVICSSMNPPGITEKQIRLRVFPFSLKNAAKDWLYYLPVGSITTWTPLKKKILEKFFPVSQAVSLRKEICSIKQYPGESLYDYWERFNKLCTRCPQHQISEQLLIQYFNEGLLTPREAWKIIESLEENSRQFGFRENNPPLLPTRKVNNEDTSSIQQQLSELTSIVRQLAMGNKQRANVCGICTSMDHCTDTCPFCKSMGWNRLEKTKMVEKEKGLLDVFRKVEINIPLLDAIKQIPKCVKFLKDLCTHKRKLRGDERVAVRENVSVILQSIFPPKCGDLGIISQLADRTNAYPKWLVENVLVQETFELNGEDTLEVVLAKHLHLGATLSMEISDELYHVVETLHSLPPISSRYEIPSVFVPEIQTKLLPSVVQGLVLRSA